MGSLQFSAPTGNAPQVSHAIKDGIIVILSVNW